MAAGSVASKTPLDPAASPLNRHTQVPLRGIGLMVASTVFFSCGDIIAKALASSMPAVEIVWLRYVTFSLILAPFLWHSVGKVGLRSSRPGLQLLRGLGMVGSALLFVLSLPFLPVADATAIHFTSPILITAMAMLLLGEKVGWRRWAAAFVGLIGVLVIIRPGTGAFQPAALLPLVAAACWAGAAVATRQISGTDHPMVTLAYSALIGLVVLTAAVPFAWVTPTGYELALAISMGAMSTAGHGLVVLAYRHASASLIAPFSYVQLIWSGALGFLAFGALPDGFTIAGAGIIAASGLYTAYRERVRASARP